VFFYSRTLYLYASCFPRHDVGQTLTNIVIVIPHPQ